jgi:3-methyladenine DNA glycosylase AlkD
MSMTFKELFNELEGLGTERNRKIYLRHGSGQNTYGVSLTNLRKMAKGLGKDQELALVLWDSGIVDAQALATLVADPDQLDLEKADSWLKEISFSLLVGLLAELVAKTGFAKLALKKWLASKREYVREGGYSLLRCMLRNGVNIEHRELESYLNRIEKEIYASPTPSRIAMNNCLIAIGTYYLPLRGEALMIAKRIGPIEIKGGNTSCKVSDAVLRIERIIARSRGVKS